MSAVSVFVAIRAQLMGYKTLPTLRRELKTTTELDASAAASRCMTCIGGSIHSTERAMQNLVLDE